MTSQDQSLASKVLTLLDAIVTVVCCIVSPAFVHQNPQNLFGYSSLL